MHADLTAPSLERLTKEDGRARTSHLISRNFRGTPFRAFSVIVALAVIVSLVFSTVVLAVGVQRTADLEVKRLGADILVLPPIIERVQSFGPAYDTLNMAPISGKYIDASVEGIVADTTGVAAISPQLYVDTLNESGVNLVGFDPQTDFTVLPWLEGTPARVGNADAFAGSSTGLNKGATLQYAGLGLKVAGVLERTNTTMDDTVFFPLQAAYQLVQHAGAQARFPFKTGEISVVLVRLKPAYPPEVVARDLGLKIPDFKVTVALGIEMRAGLDIGGLPVYQLLVESVTGTALVILVAFLFSMTINERRRQFGLLRSLGATRSRIFRLVLMEACLIALIGSVIGLGVGWGIVYLGQGSLIHLFKFGYLQPSLTEVVLLMGPSLLLGVGTGGAAALYPALIASRLDPYEAIRLGE